LPTARPGREEWAIKVPSGHEGAKTWMRAMAELRRPRRRNARVRGERSASGWRHLVETHPAVQTTPATNSDRVVDVTSEGIWPCHAREPNAAAAKTNKTAQIRTSGHPTGTVRALTSAPAALGRDCLAWFAATKVKSVAQSPADIT
jgi:hypothetical protein